jgi:fatty acid desaturase
VPRIPWYNLKRFHAMMLDEYGPAKSHIRKSYFSFLAELIIKGPLGEETWHLHGMAWQKPRAPKRRGLAERRTSADRKNKDPFGVSGTRHSN